jgi:hypothetical protein
MKTCTLLLLWVPLLAFAEPTSIRPETLVGDWSCGPSTRAGSGFEIESTSRVNYGSDGRFKIVADVKTRFSNGRVVHTRDQSVGTWKLKGSVLSSHVERAEFLSSDDPNFTAAMGQAAADAQLKKRNRFESRIVSLERELVLESVEAGANAKPTTTSCKRA